MQFEFGQKIIDKIRGKKKIMVLLESSPIYRKLNREKFIQNEISRQRLKWYKKIFDTPIEKLYNGFADIKYNGIHFQGPFTQTLNTVHEVFFKNPYDFIMPFDSYIMIDIGFNMGVTALKFAQKKEVKKIYAYEPLKPTFEVACNNLKLNPQLAKKIEAYNIGLGDKDKEVKIAYNINYLTGASSMMEDRLLSFSEKNSIEVSTIKKASDVLRPVIEGTKEKIFLKMDCEGAEFEIFEELQDTDLLKKMQVIIIEWHFKNPKRILEILQQSGFVCFCDYSESNKEIGFINAVRAV